MRGQIWILPASAAIIGGLCVYKSTREYESATAAPATCAASKFKFELNDQHMKRVRLERYLGRHPILLVFYDGTSGAEQDPVLRKLRKRFNDVQRAGLIVVGISTALPQQNRPPKYATGVPAAKNRPRKAFPFELLSDVSRESDIHRLWGRYDSLNRRPLTGTFLIDRAGRVACREGVPKPLDTPLTTIDELLAP